VGPTGHPGQPGPPGWDLRGALPVYRKDPNVCDHNGTYGVSFRFRPDGSPESSVRYSKDDEPPSPFWFRWWARLRVWWFGVLE
jgi:hypothetical protein